MQISTQKVNKYINNNYLESVELVFNNDFQNSILS